MTSPWVTRALDGKLPAKDLTSRMTSGHELDDLVCVAFGDILDDLASPEYEDFGPVLNADGSPSDVTLAMFGQGPLA